jgi:hypothetical protein
MFKHRFHEAMGAKSPTSNGKFQRLMDARALLKERPGNRLVLGSARPWARAARHGQTVVQNLILAVAVVAATLVSAALMVLISVVFDLGY